MIFYFDQCNEICCLADRAQLQGKTFGSVSYNFFFVPFWVKTERQWESQRRERIKQIYIFLYRYLISWFYRLFLQNHSHIHTCVHTQLHTHTQANTQIFIFIVYFVISGLSVRWLEKQHFSLWNSVPVWKCLSELITFHKWRRWACHPHQ